MANPVHCSNCGTQLVQHCEKNRQCHWMRCPDRHCPWWIYDLLHGLRVNGIGNKVEQLGAPPETEAAD